MNCSSPDGKFCNSHAASEDVSLWGRVTSIHSTITRVYGKPSGAGCSPRGVPGHSCGSHGTDQTLSLDVDDSLLTSTVGSAHTTISGSTCDWQRLYFLVLRRSERRDKWEAWRRGILSKVASKNVKEQEDHVKKLRDATTGYKEFAEKMAAAQEDGFHTLQNVEARITALNSLRNQLKSMQEAGDVDDDYCVQRLWAMVESCHGFVTHAMQAYRALYGNEITWAKDVGGLVRCRRQRDAEAQPALLQQLAAELNMPDGGRSGAGGARGQCHGLDCNCKLCNTARVVVAQSLGL